MLFNSYIFIFVFLPITFLIYFLLNRKKLVLAAKGWLFFASLIFYSYWNISYLPLLLGSILFNYVISNQMNIVANQKIKKALFIFGVVCNVAFLGYFKYMDFFIQNLNFLGFNIALLHLALPLAISFFTLQQIAFLVDNYQGTAKEQKFIDYAIFVSFFPQLIAGPIVHHKEMMPQFASKYKWLVRHKNIALGLFIFSIGLFKKVVIADRFAVWADKGFDISQTLTMTEAWFASLSYTLQLYFDFSGYTDMAIGAALLFNIRLPVNFYSPYKALNIREFWQRWHITLTRFLRDYLYIPLGGNRKGVFQTYRNILIVFFLAGFWHGAGWTFIVWGVMHGIALIIHRFWHTLSIGMPRFAAWLLTFNFINITWVFFRARDFDDAIKVIQGMFFGELMLPASLSEKLRFLEPLGVTFGSYLDGVGADAASVILMVAMMAVVLFFKNSIQLTFESRMSHTKMFYSALLFVAGSLSLNRVSEFIYFNF